MASPDPVATVIAAHRAGVPIRWRDRATWVIEAVLERSTDEALTRKARAALARRSR